MAWTDKPSDAQLAAWYNMTKWVLDREDYLRARAWIMDHFTKKQISDELGRIRDLVIEKRLRTKEQVFGSDLWKDYKHE